MGLRKNLDLSQTIFALATGSLPCAVAIERLSGPDAFSIARKIFRPAAGGDLVHGRGMTFGTLHDLEGNRIDDVLALGFVAPQSFTGEDVVEFQCHGSIPIVQRLESAMGGLGARPAERGEFSYRAHLNEKLSARDLESLGDVFLARQPADLSRIYSRRDGGLERQVGVLRDQLVGLQAILDTAVDFSEEYSSVIHSATTPLEGVIRGCSRIIERYSAFKSGILAPRMVIAGRPNAGKSSLFNSLLCRYRAIVHDEPGTTRDVIEEDVEVGGRVWKLVDTAGVREAKGAAEREGIALGEDFLAASSFWLLVVDGTGGLSEGENRLIERFGHIPHLVVWNKKDSPDWKNSGKWIGVSAKSGEGIPELWAEIERRLGEIRPELSEPLPTAVQCRRLESVVERLQGFREKLSNEVPPEFLAEENREILSSITAVIGEVGTEDVLDRIFSEFCIGK